jgi:hypothetical protein
MPAEPARLHGERFRTAAGGGGSPGEERGQRGVRARHQDRDPRRRGQVADHHRGHALPGWVEEEHLLGAQRGQRPASTLLPSRTAVRSAVPMARASAAYRADRALAVSAGGAWGRSAVADGHAAAVVPNTATASSGAAAR